MCTTIDQLFWCALASDICLENPLSASVYFNCSMGRLTLASDADLIGRIALSGKFPLPPVRGTEGLKLQATLQKTLNSASQTVEAP